MIIKPTLAIKSLSTAEAGELIVLGNWGARPLAIVLMPINSNGRVVLGFLEKLEEAEDVAPPFHLLMDADIACASYGTEWVLDLDEKTMVGPNANSDVTRRGIVLVGAAQTTMWFQRHRTLQADSMAYDFIARKLGGRQPQPAAAFTGWRIWSSEEARADPRAAPLLTFSIGAPTA